MPLFIKEKGNYFFLNKKKNSLFRCEGIIIQEIIFFSIRTLMVHQTFLKRVNRDSSDSGKIYNYKLHSK